MSVPTTRTDEIAGRFMDLPFCAQEARALYAGLRATERDLTVAQADNARLKKEIDELHEIGLEMLRERDAARTENAENDRLRTDVVQEVFRRAGGRRLKATALAGEDKFADAAFWQAVAVGMEQVALWLQNGDLRNTPADLPAAAGKSRRDVGFSDGGEHV